MFGCCWFGNVCDIIQAGAAVVLLCITWKGGSRAYQQWKSERAVKRSEFFESLIDRFEKDYVHCKVSLADDPMKAEILLNEVFSDKQREPEVQSSLRLFSYLCYLKDNGLIDAKEFGMFENTLRRILSNEKAQVYIRATIKRLGNDDTAHPFQSLLDYAVRHRINDAVYATRSDSDAGACVEQESIDDPTDRSIIETNSAKPPLTVEELSQHPVAVIRINRLYRPNMKPEELYAVTRGWWRVNLDIANKAEYVLSVAEGYVKEVYARKGGWHRYEANAQSTDVDADGRYQFDGDPVKDESIRRLYLGRSIQGVFKQGDAYPVRYFGIRA